MLAQYLTLTNDEEQAMSQYRTFTAADAVDYARQFGGLDNPSAHCRA
jgi:hypothetical protein